MDKDKNFFNVTAEEEAIEIDSLYRKRARFNRRSELIVDVLAAIGVMWFTIYLAAHVLAYMVNG